MPRRLLALVAAIAMVAGAFAVRGWLDRREEDKANPPGLVCIPELEALCRRIAEDGDAPVNVKMEPPGQTARRTVSANGAGDIDGWLTLSHWPAIAEAQRGLKGLPAIFTSADNPVLARSPVVLSVWPDRAGVIRENCAGQIEWKCLGTVAQKRLWKDVPSANAQRSLWGPVKLAVPDAADGATGLVAFGAATANYFGRGDVSNIDFEDDGYRSWAGAFVDATPLSAFTDFNRVLATGPSATDVYAGLEAEIAPLLAKAARAEKPDLIYPSPVATADLVLATVPGRAGDRLRDIVQDAVDDHLAELGWRVGTATRNPPIPPDDDGLPEPGTLDALRQVWKEAA